MKYILFCIFPYKFIYFDYFLINSLLYKKKSIKEKKVKSKKV